MLEYIKQQLQEMNPSLQEDAVQEQLMDEAVLECAHLFQEFDDLTMNGTITNGPRQFANVDIPLADDIEITSVELNLLDNRVVDVPMDATVQETSDYSQMKTLDDFYQEALETTRPLGRETRGVFEGRCYSIAERNYQEYMDYVVQEGLFGFDKISINDPRVPSSVKVHFGERKGEEYSLYLDCWFVCDKKNRITKKQLESINIFSNMMGRPDSGRVLQQVIFERYGGMCEASSVADIWEHVKPIKLHVPVDPADKYCVYIEFEFDNVDTNKMIVWAMPIKEKGAHNDATKGLSSSDLKPVSPATMKSLHTISKKEGSKLIKEAAEWKPRTLNRFAQDEYYQEGIDFGDADAPPSTDENASGVSFGNGDAAPDANAGGTDANATTDAPPAEGAANDAPKEVAVANNVSDQIAEKVADETQNDANEEGLSVDGVDDATADADVSDLDTTDAPTEEDVNAELGDVDENSTDEAGATSDVDVDNMTPEELKAAAADKIEKMTFQQIKDFLNNGEGTTSDELPEGNENEGVQEAFFLTRGNIGKELDIHLRKTLGVLNDSEMEIGTLCAKFRKQGKRLNYVVHKASKMTDVFNEGERKQLLKLNALLSDLMAMMRADLDPQGVQAVKRLIKAFVQQATGVAKLVEQKQPGKPVQESANDIDTIESKTGVKLPDGFKKLYESKKYQALIHKDVIVYDDPDHPDWDITYRVYDDTQIAELINDVKDISYDKPTLNDFIQFAESGEETVAYCTKDGRAYLISSYVDPPWLLNQYTDCKDLIDKLYAAMNKKSSNKPVQEAYYPPKDLNRFKSHIAECESIIGRSLPDGYKRLLEYGIENIGIKGADGWFQGCEWEIFDSSLRDRDKYDYAGHPGSEFIPLANNGRGDEILMGNTSKTDTRIFTYIHDVQNGLKQIANSWDEFEELLFTRKETDSKHDTTKIDFFGTECPVRIPRGISLKDTFIAIEFANQCGKLLNDSVRKQIRDYMEQWKSEMTDDERNSADWKHPEKHMKPAYVYVNDHKTLPRTDGRYDWKVMLDCDWEFDSEHGLSITFDDKLKFKNVGQAGNYL